MLDPKKKLFRWGPISACPLFMYFTVEPAFGPLKELLGICYPESLVIFHDQKITWVLDEKETAEESKKFAQKYAFDKKGLEKYLNLWNQRTAKLRSSFRKLEQIKFAQLSQNQLINAYNKFSKIYYDWWLLTISLELATITLEPELGQRLKKYYSNTKEYNHAFSILSSPPTLTFYRQEQKDLLSILLLPENQQKETLKNHQKKYFWILNSYLKSQILDLSYFLKDLEKLGNTNFKKSLKEIKDYPSHIKREKQNIYKKIHHDKNFRQLVSLVEKFSTLQNERKMDNFKAEHFLEEFVKTFSQKSKIDKNSLKCLVLNELSEIFTKDFHQTFKSRQKSFVFHCTDKEIIPYEGQNALLLANRFINLPHLKQNIIQGQVASLGKIHHFRGTAKIVLTVDQIHKLKSGDILITTMTSPDFIIGMKKAGAIITDIGGMLSHAAIVARELKKPCIVGTEIATKVIHDGDVVELHNGKGTIRILSSSQ